MSIYKSLKYPQFAMAIKRKKWRHLQILFCACLVKYLVTSLLLSEEMLFSELL